MLVDGCEGLGRSWILRRFACSAYEPVGSAFGARGSAPDQFPAPGLHCGSPAIAPISETGAAGCASREQSLPRCGSPDRKRAFPTQPFVGVSACEHVFPGGTNSRLETAAVLPTVCRRHHHYLPWRDGGFQAVVPQCVAFGPVRSECRGHARHCRAGHIASGPSLVQRPYPVGCPVRRPTSSAEGPSNAAASLCRGRTVPAGTSGDIRRRY